MEYINLTITQLAAAEYRRSSMQDRGVWITLLGYCVQQENGGRVTGAQTWTDWDCQQVLGIPAGNIEGEHLLWHYEDDDLIVQFYPLSKQREVQAKRRAGKRGGLSSGEARLISAPSTALSSASRTAGTERNGKEGKDKGKEKVQLGAPRRGFVAPTLAEWMAYAEGYAPSWPPADARSAFEHYLACGWRMGEGRGKQVVDWRACVRTCVVRAEKNRSRHGAPPPDNPNAGLTIFEPAPAAAEGGGS